MFDLWSPEVTRCRQEEPELKIVFIHIMLHNDEYGWMGTAKKERKQTAFSISAGEFSRFTRKETRGFSNFCVLLSNSNVLEQEGGWNNLLSLFTEDLIELSRGVLINGSDGSRCLVFAYVTHIVGDIPARKRVIGLNKTVNCDLPCHFCEVKKVEILAKLKGRDRQDETFRILMDLNNNVVGEISNMGRDIANAYSISEISEIWRWPGQPSIKSICIDLMHSDYLGTIRDVFEYVSSVLRTGVIADEFWRRVREEYKAFCDLNKISSFYAFTSFNSWKGLKAHGIKQFLTVSPFIFMKLGLVPENDEEGKKRDAFNFWCLHAKVSSLLSCHDLTRADVNAIKTDVEKLLTYHKEHLQTVSMPAHLMLHWGEMMMDNGVPREYWCFANETQLGVFKKYYRNSNNRSVAVSVYQRQIMIRKMNLLIEKLENAEPNGHRSKLEIIR